LNGVLRRLSRDAAAVGSSFSRQHQIFRLRSADTDISCCR